MRSRGHCLASDSIASTGFKKSVRIQASTSQSEVISGITVIDTKLERAASESQTTFTLTLDSAARIAAISARSEAPYSPTLVHPAFSHC